MAWHEIASLPKIVWYTLFATLLLADTKGWLKNLRLPCFYTTYFSHFIKFILSNGEIVKILMHVSWKCLCKWMKNTPADEWKNECFLVTSLPMSAFVVQIQWKHSKASAAVFIQDPKYNISIKNEPSFILQLKENENKYEIAECFF